MRAFVVLLPMFWAVAASAQSASTQCRWIGSIWSCDTTARPGVTTAPVDQSAALKQGADLIGDMENREMKQRQLDIQERELRLRERESIVPSPPQRPEPRQVDGLAAALGLEENQVAMFNSLLMNCPSSDSPTPLDRLPEDRRSLTKALCYAFERGVAR